MATAPTTPIQGGSGDRHGSNQRRHMETESNGGAGQGVQR
eukprot:CAMPEP_0171952140 /NCGR_PEP_ID=MMETSP0993-20121228/88607_1 /TAXON_ID=483369 /ORGANISM="non described non described, Strain CCMP2098" /LENGTH=39 /DNA_ID= /DNA_START= /DNA_END= /DNA_ORIENTATION=